MGLFDAPAPLFDWLDSRIGLVAPAGIRLALWGVAGALVSMLLYRILSAQKRVARGKAELAEARRTLDAHDGEFADAWPLMRRLLGAAVAQVGRVGWPALVASLPLLCLLVWAGAAFGYRYPANGAAPEIETRPPQLPTKWLAPDRAGADAAPPNGVPRILVGNGPDGMLADIFLVEPIPVIHKRQWWNALIGNPLGYLPADSMVDSVNVALPRREYLSFGPGWMQGWETAFFAPLVLASIALKVLFRIE